MLDSETQDSMTRPYKHWSKEEVVRAIHELNERGIALNSGYVARRYPALAYAGRKYWGSWQQAVEAAGLDYAQFRRRQSWSREKVVESIRELQARGEALNVSAVERSHAGLVAAACALFGAWGGAIEAAGIDYARVRRQRRWSRSLIIKEISRLRDAGFRLTTTAAVRQESRALHAAAVGYFGSWAAALRAAGIKGRAGQ